MKIKIGGVPEYFNLPIRRAIEEKAFAEAGLDVEWIDYTQGTGKMAADLANEKLDLAVLLTEGAMKAIYEGNPSKIIKTHVNSPLIWGIHIPASAPKLPIETLLHKRIAISRYGSGSHLMAVHLALQLNISPEKLQFVVVDNLDGARTAFRKKEADVFFWEKYTTKPLVDVNEFRRVGEHPSPWPAFVITASNQMTAHETAIERFREIVNEYVVKTKQMDRLELVIADRYELETEDVTLLLQELKWNEDTTYPAAFEEEILNTFERAKILGKEKSGELYFVS